MTSTVDRLKELLDYVDGHFVRKVSVQGSPKGKIVGNFRKGAYLYLVLDGKRILTHRAVFAFHNGYFPEFVDHIDGNKQNNRIENLRDVTKSQNGLNRSIHSNNKSGSKNVCWSRSKNSWVVKLNLNKTRIHLGFFEDFEFADLVAQEARNLYHGQYARHI